jgi:ribosome-associated toxin RatA of RatAB toxin-antitoxin module
MYVVNSAPIISRLAVSTTSRWHLQSLSESVRKINLRLLPQFDSDMTGGVNTEEFDEAKETLLELYDNYNE